MAEAVRKIYPHFTVANNKNPNRIYAVPLFGYFIKIIMLIPIYIWMCLLGLWVFVIYLANWFVISFTGNYWGYAYELFYGVMKLSGKIQLFLLGISDKYPGFSLSTDGIYELQIARPTKINIWLAIPLVGLIVRCVLLIPYFIFAIVLQRGSQVAMVCSWFAVTFKGRYPDSLYEFERDSLRVSFATSMYVLGLVDRYPSFSISMNHKNVKIALIVAGAILTLWNSGNSYSREERDMKKLEHYQQQQSQPQQIQQMKMNSY